MAAEIKQTVERMFDLPDIAAAGGDNGFHHRRILGHGNCLQPLHLFGNSTHGLEERVVVVHVISHDEKLHQPFRQEEPSIAIGRERPFYWPAFFNETGRRSEITLVDGFRLGNTTSSA